MDALNPPKSWRHQAITAREKGLLTHISRRPAARPRQSRTPNRPWASQLIMLDL